MSSESWHERPDKWFRYIDTRLSLKCPDSTQRAKLSEMKAARDCLEHNRGVVNRDYVSKAANAARYPEGDRVQIDEPYLMDCFALLRDVIEAMGDAAAGIAAGPQPPRRPRGHRGKGKPDSP